MDSQLPEQKINEDEDVGCYFLQPSSAPYNIAEKVQQANFDLFNSTPQAARSTKVKFRDELTSFEPELTDDDVNSIESDHVSDIAPMNFEPGENQPTSFRELVDDGDAYNTVLRGGNGIYDIEEVLEETVLEELDTSEGNEEVYDSNENQENYMHKEEELSKEEESSKNNSETYTVSSRKSSKRKKNHRRTIKHRQHQEVHCKEHCIEKIDSHLSMSIKKLEIHEKPLVALPPLQLHQRKCCDENKPGTDRALPNYKGYRSEYGLSSRQIKNRERYMEMIRQKEMARQKLMEEYRLLKMHQNEEVFCQWLKQVSKRNKTETAKGFIPKSTVSPLEKPKDRPKTAGFIPKTNIKKTKRPHTSQACVFIELSPAILKKGIHIGDLLITNSKKLTKKVHILSVS